MQKLLALLLCGVLAQNTYANLTKVTNVDHDTHIVTCRDFNGHEWQFDEDDEWHKGDLCNLVMFDNGTEEIYDDVIIGAYYERMVE